MNSFGNCWSTDRHLLIDQERITWRRHQMETFSALLGNSPVPDEFPAQRPVTRSFDVFFDLRLNKRLSKQSWGWWFETLSSQLWRHSNELSFSHADVLVFFSLTRGIFLYADVRFKIRADYQLNLTNTIFWTRNHSFFRYQLLSTSIPAWVSNYSIHVPEWLLKWLNLITAPAPVSNEPGSVTWPATKDLKKNPWCHLQKSHW